MVAPGASKKTPIVVNDSRGFFTSRVIGTFINEGIAMVAEGIPATTIEQASSQAGLLFSPLSQRAPCQRYAVEPSASGTRSRGTGSRATPATRATNEPTSWLPVA